MVTVLLEFIDLQLSFPLTKYGLIAQSTTTRFSFSIGYEAIVVIKLDIMVLSGT